MAQDMGLGFGLEKSTTIFKQKFRWLFKIPGISAEGVNALAPSKSARPSLSFKENEVQHLNESIFFPGKPEWKSFNLVLYDTVCGTFHPVFEWIKDLYDAQAGNYGFAVAEDPRFSFKKNAVLEMYSGCGDCIEKWAYDNCWPQVIDFQELDMSSSEVVMADLTIRYDRAYIIECDGTGSGSGDKFTFSNGLPAF